MITIVTGLTSPTEQQTGVPLSGSSGLLLDRTLSRGGIKLSEFNKYFVSDQHKPGTNEVVVLLGQEALNFYTGTDQDILEMRGYPIWDSMAQCWLMPIVHPDYMRQGHSDFGTVILQDFYQAIQIAKHGLKRFHKEYYLDPNEDQKWIWYGDLESHPEYKIAFDIETPWKSEDESELDFDSLGEAQRKIDRISFAYKAHHAISVEWNEKNIKFIMYVLALPNPKVVWNESFDVPIIRGSGVDINGLIHDGMVMWHTLHPGLPKKLGFVSTFLCPDQERWKHLSHVRPAFYNATDSDVEWRCVEECERQLKACGRWHVYEQQVMFVNVPLKYMSQQGMPINIDARMKAATSLDKMLEDNFLGVQQVVPNEVRITERKKPKKLPKGAVEGTELVIKNVKICRSCRQYPVTKTKHTKKVCPGHNPDIYSAPATVEVPTVIHAFNANSPKQILDYFKFKGIVPVTKKTKDGIKPTTDEKSLKILRARHPEDKLLPLILRRRKLEKLAGTYVGRIEEDGT